MDDCKIKSYRVLVLVPEPGEADPHPEGDAPHALGPDGLVQPCVDPHVLGSHLLLCKLLDLLNGKKCNCMSKLPTKHAYKQYDKPKYNIVQIVQRSGKFKLITLHPSI